MFRLLVTFTLWHILFEVDVAGKVMNDVHTVDGSKSKSAEEMRDLIFIKKSYYNDRNVAAYDVDGDSKDVVFATSRKYARSSFLDLLRKDRSKDCDSDQFTCINGQCIPESWECDDMDDCGDKSDEKNCDCDSDQFTCINGQCIPESWECDDMDDCGDNSDEKNCSCGYYTFTCENENCIYSDFICDGDDNCGDQSDEAFCIGRGNISCGSDEFTCANGQCILEFRKCNQLDDCGDNSDENNCSICEYGSFTCANQNCISDNFTCDGDDNCGDNSDEDFCGGGGGSSNDSDCASHNFTCMNGKCISESWKCNSIDDCGDNSDETNCSCNSDYFTCMNGECIVESWKCDSVDDCGDNSDEENCGGCDSDQFTCINGQCIPESWKCDATDDCGDNSDEENCMTTSSCSAEKFACPNGLRLCIPGNWECDGHPDCSDGFDEEDCENGVGWSEWTKWGPCNVVCGTGKHSRTRHCLNSDGEGCDGDDVEYTTCHLKPCYEEAETGCGTRVNQAQPRITRGQDALPGEWPWQAQLYFIPEDKIYCGGTLIGPKHIITAYHCFDFPRGKNSTNWKVRLGKYRYSSQPGSDEKPLELNIADRIERSDYSSPYMYDNDIAIVELDEEVTPTDFINYACLNTEGEAIFDKHSYCFTTGWGLTQIFDYFTPGEYKEKAQNYVPDVLQEVQMKLIPRDICNGPSSVYDGRVTPNMICAGNFDRGSCKGDSGGPLVCLHQNSDDGLGHWYLVGVVSWASDMCAVTDGPVVFVKVDKYLEWIETKAIFLE